jgi:type II secretory pathway component PulM
MPLEGHFKRVNTPLRQLTKRERSVVIAGVVVTFAALAALLLATSGDSRPPPAPGCIRASVAGRTGAELIQACGLEARELCARSAGVDQPQYRAIAASCSEQGIRSLGGPPPAAGSVPTG